MNSLQKFEDDKTFRTTVLRYESMIDYSIVNADIEESGDIEIKAPKDLTTEIFEVLWHRYMNSGWNSFSWNKEKGIINLKNKK